LDRNADCRLKGLSPWPRRPVGAGLNPVAFLGFLARRDPHDLDGIADHVSDELLASGAFRYRERLDSRDRPRDFSHTNSGRVMPCPGVILTHLKHTGGSMDMKSEYLEWLELFGDAERRRCWLLLKALECSPLAQAIDLARAADEFLAGAHLERRIADMSIQPRPTAPSPHAHSEMTRPAAEEPRLLDRTVSVATYRNTGRGACLGLRNREGYRQHGGPHGRAARKTEAAKRPAGTPRAATTAAS
jgi:hypothetical protein